MQFSEQWLREFVSPSVDTAELVQTLTMLGLEVDSVTPASGEFTGVVVGHVKSVVQHPNADRLKVCQVDLGSDEQVQVVCGGVNVRAGLQVAFVKVGGELPGGFKIKKAKLRGVESSGMICSAKELGLGEGESGFILELQQDAPLGADFREYMQLNDTVLDVDLTPNRGDCASVFGLARDVSAKYRVPLNAPTLESVAPVIEDTLPVTVAAKNACPRYVGRIIKHINPNVHTPLWMQERLRRSGLRSIHPVVDISNYVMLEYGQPTHAFDLEKLVGDITVRYANPGETLKLLDDRELALRSSAVVVADEQGPQAIAGVMGGLATAVSETTTSLFLESAYFDPESVCITTRQINTQTDSSYRFERGVDWQAQSLAAERFTALVLEICGGEPGPLFEVCEQEALPAQAVIELRKPQIKRLLGFDISAEDVVAILSGLGMRVLGNELGWQVTVPSYRSDITQEIDLIEELVRLFGYEHLPTTMQTGALKVAQTSSRQLSMLRFQQYLSDLGFSEAITYSFIDPKVQQLFDVGEDCLRLANPLSAELSVMRTSLLPGLIQALQYNLNRQVERLRLFEIGLVFSQANGQVKQTAKVAGLLSGLVHELQWGERSRKVDFFDLKGSVEQLFALGHQTQQVRYERAQHPVLHPGQSSDVYLGDELVGIMGALHPRLVDLLGLSETPYVFEFDHSKLLRANPVAFEMISKFPAVRRDLAIVIDDNISAAAVESVVRTSAGQLLRDMRIFDIYQGESIGLGEKSVAMGLIFQDPARTLVDEEINQAMARVVEGLEGKLKATLRA